MNKMKHILAISTILLVGRFATVQVNAEETQTVEKFENFEYVMLEDGTAEITGYLGSDSELIVPDHFGDIAVTSIGRYAFRDNQAITTVSISEGITSIGNIAFENCDALTEVSIPETVNEIKLNPFADCDALSVINVAAGNSNYTTVEGVLFSVSDKAIITYPLGLDAQSYQIPQGTKEIRARAFLNETDLVSIELPDSVERIFGWAFRNCTAPETINIPSSVTFINTYNPFANCESLKTIEVSPENENYKYESHMLIGTKNNVLVDVREDDDVTSISVPDGITEIASYAMNGCDQIVSIQLPDSLNKIGDSAFAYCINLEKIEIPDSVTEMEKSVFAGCERLESAHISENIEALAHDTFSGCGKLTEINFPSKLTSIGANAFLNCESLTKLELPDSIETIGRDAFGGCVGVTEIHLPEKLTSIEDLAFSNCSIDRLTIPLGVEKIGKWAFYGCKKLKEVSLAENLTNIGKWAFAACDELQEINIPVNVSTIGERAFSQTGLINVTVSPDNMNYTDIDGVLFSKDTSTLVYYPSGRTQTEYIVPQGTQTIGADAFYCVMSLEKVTISNEVTRIEQFAFGQCGALKEADIPENVAYIGQNAFWFAQITKAVLPKSVADMGANPFYRCYNLTEIVVAEENLRYKSVDGVLVDCQEQKIVTYPLGREADVYEVPDGIAAIGAFSFSYGEKLKEICIPDSVKIIGDQAFAYMEGIEALNLTNEITSIGKNTFSVMNTLTGNVFTIKIPRGSYAETYVQREKLNYEYSEDTSWLNK